MKISPDIILKTSGLEFEKEYRFHPVRKWRFDFAFPKEKIALEIEGGTFVSGRHVKGVGYRKDCEKYNEAVKLGWRVLRYTTDMIRDDNSCMAVDVKEIMREGQ